MGTLEDERLDLALDKSLQGSLALGLFLVQPLKVLIELSLRGFHPRFDGPSAFLFLALLVAKLVLDVLDHLQDAAVPSLLCFGTVQHLLFGVAEVLEQGSLLQGLAQLRTFLQILQFLEEMARLFSVPVDISLLFAVGVTQTNAHSYLPYRNYI